MFDVPSTGVVYTCRLSDLRSGWAYIVDATCEGKLFYLVFGTITQFESVTREEFDAIVLVRIV